MKINYTIEKMKNKLEYIEGGSLISSTGYAFIDEMGNTIIIVYGENNRDRMSEYLDDDNANREILKYKYINIR